MRSTTTTNGVSMRNVNTNAMILYSFHLVAKNDPNFATGTESMSRKNSEMLDRSPTDSSLDLFRMVTAAKTVSAMVNVSKKTDVIGRPAIHNTHPLPPRIVT